MRSMSRKARIGWILALFIGWMAFMAIVAAQPAWGFHVHYSYPEKQAKHGERVHYYTIMVACTENRLKCVQLPVEQFNTFSACDWHVDEVKDNQDRYGIPGYPLVMGKCISRSSPFNGKEL